MLKITQQSWSLQIYHHRNSSHKSRGILVLSSWIQANAFRRVNWYHPHTFNHTQM